MLRCAAIIIHGASVEGLASQVYRCVDQHLKVKTGARKSGARKHSDTGAWADLGHWARQEGWPTWTGFAEQQQQQLIAIVPLKDCDTRLVLTRSESYCALGVRAFGLPVNGYLTKQKQQLYQTLVLCIDLEVHWLGVLSECHV